MIILRVTLCLILFSLIINQAEACGQSPVRVAESVDARDLKSLDIGHEGSTPSLDTINAPCVEEACSDRISNPQSELRLGASPSKWWVTMPLTSWHKENKDYNERNWGIGLEHKQTETWSWVGGTYRNSFYKQSYYLGGVYAPLKLEIREVNIKLGLLLGLFSGYENKIVFLTPPVIQVEAFKKWGGDLLIGDGFVGFSLKFNKGVLE